MQLNSFTKLNVSTPYLSFSLTQGVVLLKDVVKKLTSWSLMLIFTIVGLVVLAVSVVLMTAESLVWVVLPQAKAVKKPNLQDLLRDEFLSSNKLSPSK
jgi:hypothetical protein